MGLDIPIPQPPRIGHPVLVFGTFALGLVFVLACTWFVDQLGTSMYKRGFAKPFYILGRRIHHSCIYVIVPAAYVLLGWLFLLGFVHIQFRSIWVNLGYGSIIAALAMAVDFVGDRYWPTIRSNAVLHHEWIYTLVPAYIFTFVVHFTI